MSRRETEQKRAVRLTLVLGTLGLAGCALLARAVYLHVFNSEFLQTQGDARYLRVATVAAHRGMLTDRGGEPLAISTPVDSIWANPKELMRARERWGALARSVGLEPSDIERLLTARMDREFVYLRRRVAPELAQRVVALGIDGVSLQREYRRYYPTGEVSAHVVGFTDVDDKGQEGLELAFEEQLRGTPGAKRVIKDRLGRVVENVESISEPRPGRDLRLSLDKRIQYLAYRELKAAVQRNQARSGSAVVLDAGTGEVLAMVNQPAYNPNNRSDLSGGRYRNRAVTDVFEPGSTAKPFTIAAALESGRFRPQTPIDTTPGMFRLAGFTIRDARNYGRIDVSTVIQKSSNVGATRIALALEPRRLWEAFTGVGFGYATGSGFPGEAAGVLKAYQEWREVERASMAYGYGISVTTLQLAQAYSALAGDGRVRPVSFLALEPDQIQQGRQVFSPETTSAVRAMLERVVADGGTGTQAQIPGYRVAGKTGTVRKASAGGYTEDKYMAVFAGMAPASRPRLVMIVMIDEPQGGVYYGGQVAAPVFARVMSGALRLLDVPPDDLRSLKLKMAQAGDGV